MKKIILLLLALLCYNAHSQVITDTILYAWEECDDPIGDPYSQYLNFILDKDTLWIEGDIIANCCGFHFLIYEISTDTILLTRLDTGYLCDCYCLFEINEKIGNCTADSFRIILAELFGYDAIDTLIKKTHVGITHFGQNDMVATCIPNPFSEKTTLTIPFDGFNNHTIVIFDCSGKIVRIMNNIQTNNLVIERGDLMNGVYYFQIFTYEKFLYSGKLIVK
ncbi:MAG: T9SS type A sorting domain-containing protein [Bacteroidales bacterium]|nr:T9SS type A sorting domain-containing protein [Bacteroidales bacterium]